MATALEKVRGQRHAPAALYPRKDPEPIVQQTGWAPGPVWTGAENLAPTGIRSQDRPARNQSLYRLLYPAHNCMKLHKNCGILHYIFDKSVQNTLQHFPSIVRAVCKLMLAIQEYDFDLESGSTQGGGRIIRLARL